MVPRSLGLAACLIVLTRSASAQFESLPPIPYLIGQSLGPLSPVSDPGFEAELLTYGNAFWQLVDSNGVNQAPMLAFAPSGVRWTPAGAPSELPVDHDPFGEGVYLFQSIFSHRLQLDPSVGSLVNLDDLIASDFWVGQQWRYWTRTHQFVTADFMDPVAHQKHLLALIDALSTAIEYTTRGIPYFDVSLTVLASENTKKLKGTATVPQPVPVPIAGLPVATQAKDALVRQRSTRLTGFNGLYQADGWWFGGDVGFDCDDFADAIGSYTIKGEAGAAATTVRVTWTDPGGTARAHRVTKITCGGHYWLVDGQTGAVSGPHANATAVDARPILGGYNIDNTKPIVTIDDGRALGSRSGFAEPAAWFTDAGQLQRFQNVTGLDPACFH